MSVEKNKSDNHRMLGILISVLLLVVSVVCVYLYLDEESYDDITWVG